MSDSSDSVPDSRLARTARTGAAMARRLQKGMTVLTWAAAGAGLLLWGLLWWPPALRPVPLVGAGATLLFLLAPAAVLGVLGHLWALVRQIWALRTVLSENRALLLRYGALLRFVTPGFLLLVVLAGCCTLEFECSPGQFIGDKHSPLVKIYPQVPILDKFIWQF